MDSALVDVEAVDGGGRKGSVAQESARSTTMRREGSARIRSRKCQVCVWKDETSRNDRFTKQGPRRPPAQQALAKVATGW